ncbi:MAG TPA: hypothetical protein VL362_01920 [Patescibacteria group bacterium]|nr:hypothetical protein [Patescibacteria group bacterium]
MTTIDMAPITETSNDSTTITIAQVDAAAHAAADRQIDWPDQVLTRCFHCDKTDRARRFKASFDGGESTVDLWLSSRGIVRYDDAEEIITHHLALAQLPQLARQGLIEALNRL